ncbi:MAG: TetR family transcriptional regulator [Frankiales bacterium]|nr:TetR family transcriptional regulator [Frankiales bacterium]
MAARNSRTPAARPRRARGSITPEEVIKGAFELCQAESLDALSMPRLAQHLNVGATSIYWYFKSKDDLLDALTEEAFRRFYAQMPPLEGRRWDDMLREFFTNFRSILQGDDALCDLTIMRFGHYSDTTVLLTWTQIEEILEVLVNSGFSADSATYAYFTLSIYTRGSLSIERGLRAAGMPFTKGHPRAALAAKMPIISSEAETHSFSMVSDDDFQFGIENNIRGLRALLATERKASRASQ